MAELEDLGGVRQFRKVEPQKQDWRTRAVLWLLTSTNPRHAEMEEDRRRMRQLAKDSSDMFRQYSNQERHNIESRRSLCSKLESQQERIAELEAQLDKN